MSIVGFVGIGLIVIVALFMFLMSNNLSSLSRGPYGNSGMPGGPIFIGVIYLVMAAVYIAPIIYMFNFSTNILKAVRSNSSQDYETSFEFLKKHFKYIGIFTIIILSLYALIFIFAIVGALASM